MKKTTLVAQKELNKVCILLDKMEVLLKNIEKTLAKVITEAD